MTRFILRQIILSFSWVPFAILFLQANVLKFLLQQVFSYRRKVAEDNILLCFPALTDKERSDILKDSYSNLSDIILESIKGLSMNKDEMLDRYVFSGHEKIHHLLSEKNSCIVCCGHISNWEWGVKSFGYHFGEKAIGIYKPISSPVIEEIVNQLRARSGLQLISTKETRKIEEQLHEGRMIIMMADQNPSDLAKAIWVNFFDIETPCLHGIAKYAKQYALPVFFADIQRKKRGRYEVQFSLLIETPEIMTEQEITQVYMSKVEKCIRRLPGDWLWSHKRFKNLGKKV
jgi:Kdo2-lipid IVA lauroyltransferase/acyltransferase